MLGSHINPHQNPLLKKRRLNLIRHSLILLSPVPQNIHIPIPPGINLLLLFLLPLPSNHKTKRGPNHTLLDWLCHPLNPHRLPHKLGLLPFLLPVQLPPNLALIIPPPRPHTPILHDCHRMMLPSAHAPHLPMLQPHNIPRHSHLLLLLSYPQLPIIITPPRLNLHSFHPLPPLNHPQKRMISPTPHLLNPTQIHPLKPQRLLEPPPLSRNPPQDQALRIPTHKQFPFLSPHQAMVTPTHYLNDIILPTPLYLFVNSLRRSHIPISRSKYSPLEHSIVPCASTHAMTIPCA